MVLLMFMGKNENNCYIKRTIWEIIMKLGFQKVEAYLEDNTLNIYFIKFAETK